MARLESVALGGYYATPLSVVELIGNMLTGPPPKPANYIDHRKVVMLDPCAGEGEALFHLKGKMGSADLYMVELETTRAATIKAAKQWNDHLAEGDFFHLYYKTYSNSGGSLLWLNPPYDYDPEMGRLEERFLQRATPLLKDRGLLVFLVPYYALKASAETLATNYTGLQCFKFPAGEFEAFQQVVVFGRKAPALSPEFAGLMKDQVLRWAASPEGIPELGGPDGPTFQLITGDSFDKWEIAPINLEVLRREYDPWLSDRGAVPGAPPDDALGMFHRVYPVASRPRAVHLSAALSAGVFNGLRVESDSGDLPPLLVKGVFEKEFRKVEEKRDKNGKVVAEVQVQQPKLRVTVLDLSTGKFHQVSNSAEPSSTVSIDNLSMRDLLARYGKALMKGMVNVCPVIYDPANDPTPAPMPDLARPLYPAQEAAVRTILKIQETHPDSGVIILGEIGSGKTSVALATAKAMGCRKPLVVCPPHLLESWKEQIQAVTPDVRVHVLERISDVERFVEAGSAPAPALEDDPFDLFRLVPPSTMDIGLLSREKAKLGHGWGSISGRCPKCGASLAGIKEDFAKSRSRCPAKVWQPRNQMARWMAQAAPDLLPFVQEHGLDALLTGRHLKSCVLRQRARKEPLVWSDRMEQHVQALVKLLDPEDITLRVALGWLRPDLAPDLARSLVTHHWDGGVEQRGDILMGVSPGVAAQMAADFEVAKPKDTYSYSSGQPWQRWLENHRKVRGGEKLWGSDVQFVDGKLVRSSGGEIGSAEALMYLLRTVVAAAKFQVAECGEPLFYAEEPRRYPLASYIQRRYPKCYDLLILDEAHEYSSRDSAQTSAAQRLLETTAPTLLLTGSLVNGYAESVYMNMYGVSPEFRHTFGRNSVARFIDRYGYWKQVVSEKDFEGNIVEFGSQSDRVIRSARKAGVAPGILPLFQLEYILPIAVTLQKEDLGLSIPPCHEERTDLVAEGELYRNYMRLFDALKTEIKRSRFIPEQAGKLWGQMARLPSYLDLASIGNTDNGVFELRWPENVPQVGGTLIASAPPLGDDVVLPKEKWVIDRIAAEVAQKRNVLLMGWHTRMVERLVRLCSDAGFRTVHLDPNKVGTAVRQDWITKHVVQKKVQVMVCNPVVVQTGLNNLVHFATMVWYENPMCDALVFRQACGRIDRIGQQLPTRVVFSLYENTAQDHQYKLLQHKVGVSKSVDGLDPEEALRAAGVVDSEFMGFSIGRQLYQMMGDD